MSRQTTSPDHLAGDWLEIDNCAMCDEGCIFTLLTWRLLNWCSEQRTTTQLDQFYRTASSSDILATSTTYLYIYTLRVWIIHNICIQLSVSVSWISVYSLTSTLLLPDTKRPERWKYCLRSAGKLVPTPLFRRCHPDRDSASRGRKRTFWVNK